MSDLLEMARNLRPYIEQAAQSLPDADGLKAKSLYPRWEVLVKKGSVEAEAGYRFTYNGDLYKCTRKNPTFQSDWVPGNGTAALYVRIDEAHAGTLADPIPYDGNMELKAGLYYIQSGVTYLCNRNTGQPVYNSLAELVGLYVETVRITLTDVKI